MTLPYASRIATAWRAWVLRLLALLCALAFACSAWHTLRVLKSPPAAAAAPAAAAGPGPQAQRIVEANLFDEAGAGSADIASLDLRGIFAGTGQTPSYALISTGGQPGKSYRVGSRVAGMQLSAIEQDQVVLKSGGKEYILRLKGKNNP